MAGLPSWASFNAVSRVLSGTPNATATTTVTYTVRDDDGDMDSVQFTLTIAPAPNLVPNAPAVAGQTGIVGRLFSATLPVGTGGNLPLTYSVSGLPSWASFNAVSRVLSGTPNAAATTTVTYTVRDDNGDEDSVQFTLTIAPNLIPTAPAVADQNPKVGNAFSFTLPPATGGNPPLAYSVAGLPSWASFNAVSRVLSGTPNATATTTVTYTVRDDNGDQATRSFDLVVTTVPAHLRPPQEYRFQVDTNDNGLFDGILATFTDRVIELSWQTGLAAEQDRIAPPSTLKVSLNNADGAFYPDKPGAAYRDVLRHNRQVRVQARRGPGALWTTLYSGFIKHFLRINPAVISGSHAINISCSDHMREIYEEHYTTSERNVMRVDEAIALVLDALQLDAPAALDVADVELEYGMVAPGEAGRDWRAQNLIRQLVATEGGRFWFDGRTGQYVFRSRYYDGENHSGDDVAIPEEHLLRVGFLPGQDPVNLMQMGIQALEERDSQLIYDDDSIYEIDDYVTETFTLTFSDPDDGATLVRLADVVVQPYALESGSDDPADDAEDVSDRPEITVSISDENREITIAVRNPTTNRFEMQRLRVYSGGLYHAGLQQVVVQDEVSQQRNGIWPRNFAISMVRSPASANSLMTYHFRRQDFRSRLLRVSDLTFLVDNNLRYDLMEEKKTGSYCRVALANTGHDQKYVIIGERHSIKGGSPTVHEVTWILDGGHILQYWKLGTAGESELGNSTWLG